jgi:hypothetical protein
MKKLITPFIVMAGLACGSIANASITGASWNSDGDADLVCTYLYPFYNDTLTMDGIQYGPVAHMLGTVTTDTVLDPTLFLGSEVDNDTSLIWTDYHVNVVMAVPFTFVGTPTVSNPSANDWFVSSVSAPAFQVSGPYAGLYEGTINFLGGTQIGIGGTLDFFYGINFSSSLDYAFTQEMIPSGYAVPEPGTLAFAAVGGLMLALRLRRNARA